MSYLLCFITYVRKEIPEGRKRIREALFSLYETGYRDNFLIVDDGSKDEEHLDYLQDFPTIFREHGGISRAKNTALKFIKESEVDVGIIVEDDIEFKEGWLERYLEAHEKGFHHLSWAWDDAPCMHKKRFNEFLDKTTQLNGVLLTFSQEVIRTVGGFRVMPYDWGHEHTNWTCRAVKSGLVPCFLDIKDSNKFIGMNRYCSHSSVPDRVKRVAERVNEEYLKDSKIYREIVV